VDEVGAEEIEHGKHTEEDSPDVSQGSVSICVNGFF